MPATRPKLPELQRWFFASLGGTAAGATGRIRRGGHLTPSARFAVYRGMYFARLIEALGHNYPSVEKALGAERFARLARAYLGAHPSRHPSLRYLGRRWPEHLARHPVRGSPQLADLARLDRAVLDSFDAPDVVPLRMDDLKGLAPQAWPALRFRLAPHVHLLRFAFDVITCVDRPVRRRTDARVFRLEHEVRQAAMDAREARALRAVERGRTFGDVCVVFGDAQVAANTLATWLTEGLLLKWT